MMTSTDSPGGGGSCTPPRRAPLLPQQAACGSADASDPPPRSGAACAAPQAAKAVSVLIQAAGELAAPLSLPARSALRRLRTCSRGTQRLRPGHAAAPRPHAQRRPRRRRPGGDREEKLAGSVHVLLQRLHERRLGHRADDGVHLHAVLEEHDGGDAADAVLGRHAGALVCVQLQLRARAAPASARPPRRGALWPCGRAAAARARRQSVTSGSASAAPSRVSEQSCAESSRHPCIHSTRARRQRAAHTRSLSVSASEAWDPHSMQCLSLASPACTS